MKGWGKGGESEEKEKKKKFLLGLSSHGPSGGVIQDYCHVTGPGYGVTVIMVTVKKGSQ